MNNSNRRTFLRTLGLSTGAFMLGSMIRPKLARAANNERSFVFCYFRGGWDTLLGLDPRDPNVFTDANKGATKIELAWDRLGNNYPKTIQQPAGSNIQFGPVMGGIMQHYDQMCVVRGMTMETVSHEVGRLYFITGKPPRGTTAAGSSLGTRIVAQQGDNTAMPNLVARVDSFNENLPTYASGLTVNSVTDLVTTLTDGRNAPNAMIRGKLDAYRAKKELCDPSQLDRRGLLGLIQSSQTKARELVEGGLSAKFQFLSQTDAEMMQLAARYGIAGALTTPQAQAAMAYQALKYQMAQCVTIELAGSLDTHDATWATDQPDEQSTGFTALGQLVADLKATDDPVRGGKLIDHTTILAFSEFGRTGLLNGRDGRDHSLTGSCMLLGAGVPHNKVVGASGDVAMVPRAVDPISGDAVDAGGTFLTPTLVAASIMESAGYDTDDLRADGLPCLMA